MIKPKFAVLMSAYNGMNWIEEQVSTILNQKEVEVNLFISVDLSSDGTAEWVNAMANVSHNVHMLSYGERYGGAGPNFYRLIRDVDLSGFDYISFADQDDIWFDDKLIRSCSFIGSKKYDAYSSDVIAFWSDGRKELIKKSHKQREYDFLFEAAGPGCTYVFSRRLALDLKKFISHTNVSSIDLHDWLCYAFSRSRGYTWFIDSVPSMLYRQHSGNQVGSNSNINAYIKRFFLIKNNWYRNQVETLASVIGYDFIKKVISNKFLLRHVLSLRRRLRDRIALFFIIIFGIY